MLPGFGWSAGDVATACVVIFHIIKAFDDVKGAKKQYRESHAFLCGLYLIVEYISDPNKSASLPQEALIQIKSISDAYEDLRTYILKHANVGEDKTRLKNVLPKIRWSLHELNHKVQTMKTNSLDAIAIMETLVVMDLSSRVNALIQMGDRQEQSLEAASQVMLDVRQQVSSLSQASEDYQKLLDDWNYSDDEPAMDPRYIEDRLNAISKSQNDLQEKLDTLTQHLEERSRNDEVQAEQWSELLEEHKEASVDAELADKTRAGLQDTNNLIGGVGQVTKNSHLQQTASQVDGVNRVLGALGPLGGKLNFSSGGGFWGSKKSNREESQASVRQGVVRETPQPRTYKPPAPTTTVLPPPTRRTNVASPPRPTLPQRQITRPATRSVAQERATKAVPVVTTPPPIMRSTYIQGSSQFVNQTKAGPGLPPRPKSLTPQTGASGIDTHQEATSSLTLKARPPIPRKRQLSSPVTAQSSTVPLIPSTKLPLPPPLPPRKLSSPMMVNTSSSRVSPTNMSGTSYELQPLARKIPPSKSPSISSCGSSSRSTRTSSFTEPTSSPPPSVGRSLTPPTSNEVSPSGTPAPSKSTLASPQAKSPFLLELSKKLQANRPT